MSARVKISPGICGFDTLVEAKPDEKDPYHIRLTIQSDCEAVRRLAAHLTEVDAFQEISFHNGRGPRTLACSVEYLDHAACPVPAGIIKAIEVAAGLALPRDAIIKVSKTE